MAGDVTVTIGVDAAGVKPGLDQVAGAFQGWAGNANAVASATQKLEQQLKGFASEQRTQGRMARFYAGELASIIPAASGARTAIEGLAGVAIEGIAGGLSFGLAFESLKFVVGAVSQAMAEAAQRIKDMEAASLTAATGIAAAADALERMKRPAEPLAQKAFREVFDAGTRGAKDLTEQIEKLRPTTWQLVKAFMWDGALGMKRLNEEFATAAKNLDTMAAAAKRYASEAAALFPESEVFGPGNDVGAGKFDVANEKAVAAAKERLRIVELIKKAEQAIAQHQAEGFDRGAFPDLGYNEKTWQEMQVVKDRAWEPLAGPGNDQGAQQFADQLNRINTELSQMQEIWSSIGGSVSNAFSSIGNAVGGIAGKVLAWLGQMITQAIQLAVAMSAAGSAWTTPLGSLAIGATVAAGLLGLIGSISARADGGPITGMRPYLVGERGPELIVPRSDGTVIPNEQLGGGGGVSITFNAPVDQAWWRANERHIVRTLREAARGGRA